MTTLTTSTTATCSPTDPVDDFRLQGNFAFAAGRYDDALSMYTAALERLQDVGRTVEHSHNADNTTISTTTTTNASPNPHETHIILLCNRSATYYQQQEFELAEQDAQKAWDLSQQRYIKAAFRLAKTQLALNKFDAAKASIKAALHAIDEIQVAEENQTFVNQDGSSNTVTEEGTVPVTLLDTDGTSTTSTTAHAKSSDSANNQRKALEDLWNQVESAALAKENEKPETSIKLVKRPISIKEFEKGRALGYGNFSEIVIVQHKVTREQFALKMIVKKQAADLAKRQHPNVYNEIQMERRILIERLPLHRNIVRMFHAFQDYNTLYFLTELHTAWGDLWSELQWIVSEPVGDGTFVEKKYMTGCHPSQAVHWMWQLVDALEHMHRHGIVHRDLKTENILLNERGHVVVVDFGTAKDLLVTDLNGPEFVGTPDFMPPEAVSGTSGMEEASAAVERGEIGAVHTADLWAMGAMLYIMQTGRTPFWSPSPYLAFLKIKRSNLRRPECIVDDSTWDLIQNLMKHDPTQRLGADAFELICANEGQNSGKRRIETKAGGYDMIRNHPYFDSVRVMNDVERENTVIPSLRDLCIRSVATAAYQDSLDVELCDQFRPGDGSPHDMTRLHPVDLASVMHVLDRRKLLRDPRLYERFFVDSVASRLDKVREGTHEFVGLTQMNDEQGKPPKAFVNDPYSTPVAVGEINVVQITSPLLNKSMNQSCDDETRQLWVKQFKKCIANINRTRPRLVVASGFIDAKCRKLLARVNESIPVVAHNGFTYFTFWMLGVQCIALQGNAMEEGSDQVTWLRELLEQSRISKHPLFGFVDTDPWDIPMPVLKRLARGRTLALYGASRADAFSSIITYEANEKVGTSKKDDNDDANENVSIRSDESEDDSIKFAMKLEGTNENGLRWIHVDEEPDKWQADFKHVDS